MMSPRKNIPKRTKLKPKPINWFGVRVQIQKSKRRPIQQVMTHFRHHPKPVAAMNRKWMRAQRQLSKGSTVRQAKRHHQRLYRMWLQGNHVVTNSMDHRNYRLWNPEAQQFGQWMNLRTVAHQSKRAQSLTHNRHHRNHMTVPDSIVQSRNPFVNRHHRQRIARSAFIIRRCMRSTKQKWRWTS